MLKKDQTAPGRLEVLRAFINTADMENPDGEKIPDRMAATAWLQQHHLLAEVDKLDDDDFEELIEVREAFRLELLSHNGNGDSESAWAVLGDFADRAELGIRLREEPGEIELLAEGRGSQLVTGRLFAIMYDAIRADQWQRLKACRKHTCLWAFYDHSKNGSGSWCDMAVCGNRLKAQRRRQRAAAP